MLVRRNPDFDPRLRRQTPDQASLAEGPQRLSVRSRSARRNCLRATPRTQQHDDGAVRQSHDCRLLGCGRHGRESPIAIRRTDTIRADADAATPDPATDFKVWQPHFDRDFSSIFELFAVPLFGPSELTRRLADIDHHVSGFDKTPANPQGKFHPSLAGMLFTNTDPDGDSTGASPDLTDDNRWYRLLEFVEVPSRSEDSIRERLTQIVRTPGRVNLNTVRDETVLAALIDDPFIQRFSEFNQRMTMVDFNLQPAGAGSNPNPGPGNTPTYRDTRNMMDEMRLARDGVDPVNYFTSGDIPANRTFIPLPGIPGVVGDPADGSWPNYTSGRPQFGAMPFRPFSYVDPNQVGNVSTARECDADRRLCRPGSAYDSAQAHRADRRHRKRQSGRGGRSCRRIWRIWVCSRRGRDRISAPTRTTITRAIGSWRRWPTIRPSGATSLSAGSSSSTSRRISRTRRGTPTSCRSVPSWKARRRTGGSSSSTAPGWNGPWIRIRSTNPDSNGRNDNFKFDWRDFVIHRRTIQ